MNSLRDIRHISSDANAEYKTTFRDLIKPVLLAHQVATLKWIARLRRLRTDNHLLAFRTNLDAGHAGAAGRFDRLREVALAYAFAIKVAGAAHEFCTM